jgi:hypothetical protein
MELSVFSYEALEAPEPLAGAEIHTKVLFSRNSVLRSSFTVVERVSLIPR